MSFKNIPKIDELMRAEELDGYAKNATTARMTSILRQSTEDVRKELAQGNEVSIEVSIEVSNEVPIEVSRDVLRNRILKKACERLDKICEGRLRRVINATGIAAHTNLGRALLSKRAAERVMEVATNHTTLEYCPKTARRRNRLAYVKELICDLTGAEDALVVNNNAAAVFLVFNTLAAGRDVLLSRGEMVEIGDGFRINEIIARSGAKIIEVGATNRTTISDYDHAKTQETRVIARVHTSNYKIMGYTKKPPLAEMSELAKRLGIILVDDMGSGNLADMQAHGMPYEPTPHDSILAGADIVTFSGDKLLGGPQSGIIVGKHAYIEEMRRNQLLRCLRIDKLCLAGLEATLEAYVSGDHMDLPMLARVFSQAEKTKERSQTLLQACERAIGKNSHLTLEIAPHTARFGGGAMPMVEIPSYAIYVSCQNPSHLDAYLRSNSVPIISTISQNLLALDPLAIDDEDFEYIASALGQYNNLTI